MLVEIHCNFISDLQSSLDLVGHMVDPHNGGSDHRPILFHVCDVSWEETIGKHKYHRMMTNQNHPQLATDKPAPPEYTSEMTMPSLPRILAQVDKIPDQIKNAPLQFYKNMTKVKFMDLKLILIPG